MINENLFYFIVHVQFFSLFNDAAAACDISEYISGIEFPKQIFVFFEIDSYIESLRNSGVSLALMEKKLYFQIFSQIEVIIITLFDSISFKALQNSASAKDLSRLTCISTNYETSQFKKASVKQFISQKGLPSISDTFFSASFSIIFC